MNRLSRLGKWTLCGLTCLSLLAGSGCTPKGKTAGYQKNKHLDTKETIELRLASSKETWPEMDNIIAKFEQVYPNCTVICECIEEYTENLQVRLEQTEQKIDLFRTTNIQESTKYKDCALNLLSDSSKEILDLSQANVGLVDNFKYMGEDQTLYAIPYGGEMRGMYVNVTLLKKYNLQVPTNRTELMDCCKVLYDNGYIPFQSGTGTFAQQLLYPSICNQIVNGGNYEKQYASLEAIDDGVSEYFRDAYTFLYDIVEKGYFDYKRAEEECGYTFAANEGKARDFLNITAVGEDSFVKQDDIGKIAFMVDTQAFESSLAKTKSDYHSEIEYQFITSPVGEDGGYAYLSPADGLAINKQSDHTDWALEYLNFFFTPENAKAFAAEAGKIPNTQDALLQYDIPAERASDVGQMTFSYPFYKTVTTLMLAGYDDMIGISKMNAQKYMKENADGTYSLMYTVDDYLERLEKEFQSVRKARETQEES